MDDVVRQTNGTLDREIILALMEVARRLNLPDNRLEGIERRRVQQQRVERAQLFENSFVEYFQSMQYRFLREIEQREQAKAEGSVLRLTPDIWFPVPVFLCRKLCNWVEYKRYFGFPKNPFVAGKEKWRVQNYLTEFGPGAIVFELGFQSGHLKQDGIWVFRAKDVLDNLTLQGVNSTLRV